ncbi:hypothetical protein GEMRC1_010272 [Eukaryota sp. GEM-RC1]
MLTTSLNHLKAYQNHLQSQLDHLTTEEQSLELISPSSLNSLLDSVTSTKHELTEALENLSQRRSYITAQLSGLSSSTPIVDLLLQLRLIAFHTNILTSSPFSSSSIPSLELFNTLSGVLLEEPDHVLCRVFTQAKKKVKNHVIKELRESFSSILSKLDWPSVPDFDLHTEAQTDCSFLFQMSYLVFDFDQSQEFPLFQPLFQPITQKLTYVYPCSTLALKPGIMLTEAFHNFLNFVEFFTSFSGSRQDDVQKLLLSARQLLIDFICGRFLKLFEILKTEGLIDSSIVKSVLSEILNFEDNLTQLGLGNLPPIAQNVISFDLIGDDWLIEETNSFISRLTTSSFTKQSRTSKNFKSLFYQDFVNSLKFCPTSLLLFVEYSEILTTFYSSLGNDFRPSIYKCLEVFLDNILNSLPEFHRDFTLGFFFKVCSALSSILKFLKFELSTVLTDLPNFEWFQKQLTSICANFKTLEDVISDILKSSINEYINPYVYNSKLFTQTDPSQTCIDVSSELHQVNEFLELVSSAIFKFFNKSCAPSFTQFICTVLDDCFFEELVCTRYTIVGACQVGFDFVYIFKNFESLFKDPTLAFPKTMEFLKILQISHKHSNESKRVLAKDLKQDLALNHLTLEQIVIILGLQVFR